MQGRRGGGDPRGSRGVGETPRAGEGVGRSAGRWAAPRRPAFVGCSASPVLSSRATAGTLTAGLGPHTWGFLVLGRLLSGRALGRVRLQLLSSSLCGLRCGVEVAGRGRPRKEQGKGGRLPKKTEEVVGGGTPHFREGRWWAKGNLPSAQRGLWPPKAHPPWAPSHMFMSSPEMTEHPPHNPPRGP